MTITNETKKQIMSKLRLASVFCGIFYKINNVVIILLTLPKLQIAIIIITFREQVFYKYLLLISKSNLIFIN